MEHSVGPAGDRIELTTPVTPSTRSRRASDADIELRFGRTGRSLMEASTAFQAAQAVVDRHLCASLNEMAL